MVSENYDLVFAAYFDRWRFLAGAGIFGGWHDGFFSCAVIFSGAVLVLESLSERVFFGYCFGQGEPGPACSEDFFQAVVSLVGSYGAYGVFEYPVVLCGCLVAGYRGRVCRYVPFDDLDRGHSGHCDKTPRLVYDLSHGSSSGAYR
jgi:hypothetical protein